MSGRSKGQISQSRRSKVQISQSRRSKGSVLGHLRRKGSVLGHLRRKRVSSGLPGNYDETQAKVIQETEYTLLPVLGGKTVYSASRDQLKLVNLP